MADFTDFGRELFKVGALDLECGTCGDTSLILSAEEGDCMEAHHWIVACGNGHTLVPTGQTYMLRDLTVGEPKP